ncbi:hypothetical protein ECANGB1_2643 [Enterospora canceri]|uniref:Uncharacterized protein n=1 Tax=Enterospora canceri TaxID=1081671 RepID=A0A1Y1S989_9MICR|nr:hypothetical protein ECANGB1_2643 [Enterospora canceri]
MHKLMHIHLLIDHSMFSLSFFCEMVVEEELLSLVDVSLGVEYDLSHASECLHGRPQICIITTVIYVSALVSQNECINRPHHVCSPVGHVEQIAQVVHLVEVSSSFCLLVTYYFTCMFHHKLILFYDIFFTK